MQFPLEIAFEGIPQDDALKDYIRTEAAALDHFASRISRARIVLGRPHRRYHTVKACRVHIQIERPGAPDIVITRDPAITGADEDVRVTIGDAFKALHRRLVEAKRQPPLPPA
jgi:hypothetical protein